MIAAAEPLEDRQASPGSPLPDDLSIAPKKRRPRVLARLGSVVVIAGALVILAVGVGVRTGNLHLQPVLSGSMRPGVQPGDLAATWRVPTSSLRVGEVITFFPPGQTLARMHRIASITRATDNVTGAVVTTVSTVGDANHGKLDPWDPIVISSASSYRLAAVIPKLGWIPVRVSQLPGKSARSMLLIAAGLLFGVVAIKRLLSGPAGSETGDDQVITSVSLSTVGDTNYRELDPSDPLVSPSHSSLGLGAKAGRSILLVAAGLLFGMAAINDLSRARPRLRRLTK